MSRKKARAEKYTVPSMAPPRPDERVEEGKPRKITQEIQANRGLTPHRCAGQAGDAGRCVKPRLPSSLAPCHMPPTPPPPTSLTCAHALLGAPLGKRAHGWAMLSRSAHTTSIHPRALQEEGPQEPAQEAPHQVCAGHRAQEGRRAGAPRLATPLRSRPWLPDRACPNA